MIWIISGEESAIVDKVKVSGQLWIDLWIFYLQVVSSASGCLFSSRGK